MVDTSDPNGVHRLNQEGVAAYRRGAMPEAVERFTRVVEILRPLIVEEAISGKEDAPSSTPSVHHELAMVLVNRAGAKLSLGEAAPAILDADEATAVDPGYAKAYRMKAEGYQSQGLAAEALDAVLEGLRVAPDDKELQALRGRLRMESQRLPSAEGPAGADRLAVRLGFLPGVIRRSARRSLWLHMFALAVLCFLVWVHRRSLARAWRGTDAPLSLEELKIARSWWSGFGLGVSFDAKLHVESVAEAGFNRVQWDDLLEKALNKKGRSVGRFLMLSWRDANSTGPAGKMTCKGEHGQVCVLCFLPGTDTELKDVGLLLKNQTIRGRLARLGREHRKWLETTKWRGDAILPLLFSVRSARPSLPQPFGGEQEAFLTEGVPDQFVGRRVMLLLAAMLAIAILRSTYLVTRSMVDFTRHAAFRTLRSFPEIALSGLAVAQELEREVADETPLTGKKAMQDGRVIVTCSWLIHCPTLWTFFERLLQPVATLVICLLNPRQCLLEPLAKNRAGVVPLFLASAREWGNIVRCSQPCGVEITRLKDCVLGSRIVVTLDIGKNWDSFRVITQHRLILRDERRRLYIEIPGEVAELEALAREILVRQSVDSRATSGAFPQEDFAVDPRSVTLEQCYEALGLSRSAMLQAQQAQPQAGEALLLLRRAFRKRALATHPDKTAGDTSDPRSRMDFERATVALEVLRRRLEGGLEM